MQKKSKIQCIFNILNPNISNTIHVFWVGSPQQYLFYSKTTYTPLEKNVKCVMALPFRQHSDGKLNISYTHFYIQIFNTLARFKSSVPPIWASIKWSQWMVDGTATFGNPLEMNCNMAIYKRQVMNSPPVYSLQTKKV